MLAFATAIVVTTEFIVVGLLPELARELGVSVAAAGWFVTWFALASALFGPPLTIVAARFPPRAALAATLLVFALGNILAVLMPSYGLLVAVRIAQGAALPVLVSIGSAAVAELAGPGGEGRAVGLVYMGVVIAIVVAVPGGVALADTAGWALSFAILAAAAFVGTLILGVSFPRVGISDAGSAAQASVLRRPLVQAHLVLSAAIFTGMFAAYSYLAAFLETVAGFAGEVIAVVLAGFGLAGVLGNWIAARVVDQGPTRATAGVAILLMLAMSVASLVGARLALLLPLLAVWGAAHTAAFLLCQVRVMLAAPAAPAFASSLNISACNLGIAVGAATGGWVVDHFGVGMIGLGGGALSAGALVIALAIQRRTDVEALAATYPVPVRSRDRRDGSSRRDR
jgi:predicted MFS family arabinose efflux permease